MTKKLDAKGNQFEVMYFGTYKNAKHIKTNNMILYNEESKNKFEIELGQARAVDPLLERALYEIENYPGIMTREIEDGLNPTFPNFQPSKLWMTELQNSMIL